MCILQNLQVLQRPRYSRWRPAAMLNYCFVHEIYIVHDEKVKICTYNRKAVPSECKLFKYAFQLFQDSTYSRWRPEAILDYSLIHESFIFYKTKGKFGEYVSFW